MQSQGNTITCISTSTPNSDDNNEPNDNGDGVEGDSIEKGYINTQEDLVFKVKNRKHYQVFQCAAKQCFTLGGHVIKRNMDTADAMSIFNLKAYAKKCFEEEVVAAASRVRNLTAAQDVMKDKITLKCSSLIAVAFEQAGQQKVTYSMKTATPIEVHTNHIL
ncbi:hypothetical protein BJV74DRAFT_800296 [Russula compacta]|nr:hypothetical protein BJV74DRAFT_800296 [Russula compacta]